MTCWRLIQSSRRMLKRWEQIEKDYPRAKAEYDSKHAEWEVAAKKAKDEGKQPPPAPV